MSKQLIQEIRETFDRLAEQVSAFRAEDFDQTPPRGGWSAGQCTEHIILATEGAPSLCRGTTEPSERPATLKVQSIRDLFLDFNQRFESPDFIQPRANTHDRVKMLKQIEETKAGMIAVAETTDLSAICKDFEVPGFGPFTRYEMLSFACIHTQRHIRQLNNIYKSLNERP